jgi:hypothetical protein
MESAPVESAPADVTVAEPVPLPRPYLGIPLASVSLGFTSMILFWWFPHGLTLATVGLILGLLGLVLGVKSDTGENLPLVGVAMSLTGGTFAILCALVMRNVVGN